jgi:hypothetical protein
VGFFLMVAALFIVALLVGWQVPVCAVRGTVDVWMGDGFPVCVFSVWGVVLAALFARSHSGSQQVDRPLKGALMFATGTTLVATLGLHLVFARGPFQFLSGRAVFLDLRSSVAGSNRSVFTYPGHAAGVIELAGAELSSKGYRAMNANSTRQATFQLPDSIGNPLAEVFVATGRTTGKYAAEGGDFLQGDSDPEWVTVSVTRPDALPYAVRRLVP